MLMIFFSLRIQVPVSSIGKPECQQLNHTRTPLSDGNMNKWSHSATLDIASEKHLLNKTSRYDIK